MPLPADYATPAPFSPLPPLLPAFRHYFRRYYFIIFAATIIAAASFRCYAIISILLPLMPPAIADDI